MADNRQGSISDTTGFPAAPSRSAPQSPPPSSMGTRQSSAVGAGSSQLQKEQRRRPSYDYEQPDDAGDEGTDEDEDNGSDGCLDELSDEEDDGPGPELYPQPSEATPTLFVDPLSRGSPADSLASAGPHVLPSTASQPASAMPSSAAPSSRAQFGAASSLGFAPGGTSGVGSLFGGWRQHMSLSYNGGQQGMMQMLRVMGALEEEEGEGMSMSEGEGGVRSGDEGRCHDRKGKGKARPAELDLTRSGSTQGGTLSGVGSDVEDAAPPFRTQNPAAALSPTRAEDRLDVGDDSDVLSDCSNATPHEQQLASSLHAIHRPIEVQQRRTEDALRKTAIAAAVAQATSPSRGASEPSSLQGSPRIGVDPEIPPDLPPQSSTPTAATAAAVRRSQLASKLQDVFELSTVEDLLCEYPCHLYLSIPLQGHLFLTTGHFCFYAFLRRRSGQIIRSGALGKRGGGLGLVMGDRPNAPAGAPTSVVRHVGMGRRYAQYWFVLKNSTLSWFPNSAEPYFPLGSIDLHYVTAVAPSPNHSQHFRVTVSSPVYAAQGAGTGAAGEEQGFRRYHFSTDSQGSRDDWVKVLRREVIAAQTEGGSVKVSIPLETVEEISAEAGVEFAKTIVVRTRESREGSSSQAPPKKGDEDLVAPDTYLFTFFRDAEQPFQQMTDALATFRTQQTEQPTGSGAGMSVETQVRDSTRSAPLLQAARMDRGPSGGEGEAQKGYGLSRWVRTPRLSLASSPAPSPPPPSATSTTSTSASTATTSSTDTASAFSELRRTNSGETIREAAGMSETLVVMPHTYPPGTGPGSSSPSGTGSWTILPTWLRQSSGPVVAGAKGLVTVPMEAATALVSRSRRPAQRKVLVTMSEGSEGLIRRSRSRRRGRSSSFNRSWISTEPEELEDPGEVGGDTEVNPVEDVKFRHTFSISAPDEHLLYKCSCYLFRGLPVYGRLYLSHRHLCFKGHRPMAGTKMILPLCDVISAKEQKGFRFGYAGLIITVKGYEEIFLEFLAYDARAKLADRLRSRCEGVQQESSMLPGAREDDHEVIVLRDREGDGDSDGDGGSVMFKSTSSSFVNFKPPDPLHITCLAVGSRGDVQPYIALCKGLIKEGHKCRIASHPEYRKWVEDHGIGFAEVGGDPAELMRICVENGMFTMSFLREGISKFRGWLDDLLATSWEACKGTDLLIESPSTMGGIHIAEALQIPYFRAFTMPWTRTRAYPHAFAVPEHKMGGGYNYMTYTMFDAVFWRAIAGQINRWRRKMLGLHGTSIEKLEPHRVPFLYNFSKRVVPPPLDWYEWIHITGYWFLDGNDDAGQEWEPPEELVAFLSRAKELRKKVVYIGFGSIVVSDPEELSRTIVDAVQQSDVFAIVSKGWSDRLSGSSARPDVDPLTMPVPSPTIDTMVEAERSLNCIFNVKSVPHDWLFPRIAAACHHGGAGTTGASLRAGIPTIIKPFFGDQYFWADRVEALGVGTHLRKLNVKSLLKALTTAISDERQIAKARVIGEQIRAEKGVDTAIESLYRDLEYAKSLVKRNTRLEYPPRSGAVANSAPTTPAKFSPAVQSGSSRGHLSEGEEWDVLSQTKSERTDLASSFDQLSEPVSSAARSGSRRISRVGSVSDMDEGGGSPSPRIKGRFMSPVRRAAQASTATLVSGLTPPHLRATDERSARE